MLAENIRAFERDFEAACRKHQVTAVYVLVSRRDAQGSMLAIGGSTELSDYVEACLAQHSVEAQGRRN